MLACRALRRWAGSGRELRAAPAPRSGRLVGPASQRSPPAAHRDGPHGAPSLGQRGHGRLEGAAARGVVHEHVEAGGGRAEQHGRRAPTVGRSAAASRSRAMASARSTASSSVGASSTRVRPSASEHLRQHRPGLADQHGRVGPLRRDGSQARRGPRPCRDLRRSGPAAAGRPAARRSRHPAGSPASR